MSMREKINAEVEKIFARVRSGAFHRPDVTYLEIDKSNKDLTNFAMHAGIIPREKAIGYKKVSLSDLTTRNPKNTLRPGKIVIIGLDGSGVTSVETYRVMVGNGRVVDFRVQVRSPDRVDGKPYIRNHLENGLLDWFEKWLTVSRIFDDSPLVQYHDGMVLALGRELTQEENKYMYNLHAQGKLMGQLHSPHIVEHQTVRCTIKFWEINK